MKARPHLGETFGRLTIVEDLGSVGHKQRVRARCACGEYWSGKVALLLNGHTASCGCLYKASRAAPRPKPYRNSRESITNRLAKDSPHGCWLWSGSTTYGYGVVNYRGRSRRVHRLMWEWAHGAISPNLVLDHLCGIRRCANPAHLRAVTQEKNAEERDVFRFERSVLLSQLDALASNMSELTGLPVVLCA